MKLTDEQIASIMTKETKSKTLLAKAKDVDEIVKSYQKDGWKLIKKSEVNGRTKLTFLK